MINENIKRARHAKGVTQEEMAVTLNVVRQTVSKWEKGLSVPDADMLIKIAEYLDVSVNKLLGITAHDDGPEDLSEELARLNGQLAEKNREIKIYTEIGKKRGIILFLSFIAMLVSVCTKNEIMSVILTGGCVLTALFILYRNLALMTSAASPKAGIGVLRFTTVFNIIFLALAVGFILLNKSAVVKLTESNEKLLAVTVISVIILFGGFISPKLPFNRHTGLRLPWTVQDEDAWNIAHRIIGYISMPLTLLCWAALCTVGNFEAVILVTMILWVGIPSVLSLIFYLKKYYRK